MGVTLSYQVRTSRRWLWQPAWLFLVLICLASEVLEAQSPCSIMWQVHVGPVSQSSPAIGQDGSIYIANDARLLFSISPAGQTNWAIQSGWDADFHLPNGTAM